MKVAGRARRGVYVSDGTINVALLKQEGEEKTGIYHFGMWVDDLDEAEKKVVDAGGKYLDGRPAPKAPDAPRQRAFVLRGEVQGPERYRVRSHAHRLDRRRQGGGGEELDAVIFAAALILRRRGRRPSISKDGGAPNLQPCFETPPALRFGGLLSMRPVTACACHDHQTASSSSAPARSGCASRSRLAQEDVRVCLIEARDDDNFLEQVPRAGTNHPATLELLDRIGLYDKLEPRGIIAPLFHYWDRHEQQADRRVRSRPSQGRHALSLRAAMRAHQDRRGGAQARQGASADRPAALDRRSRRSRRTPTASPRR